MIRISLMFLLLAVTLNAAPNRRQEQLNLQQLQFSVGNIRNEIDNHEAEILMFEQRLNNQETTLELLREEIHTKKNDPGVHNLEGRVGALVGDIQKLRTHANEVSDAVGKTQKRIGVVEATLEKQERNIANMQTALKSLLEALDIKDPTIPETYKVQSGDSLEKIARKNHTNIKKLKELNGLKTDRIRIGQKLKIPPPTS